MSAVTAVRTARQEPSPAAATNRKPSSISTIVWRTPPGAEVAAGALGQAVESGGDGREVFGVLAAQGRGRAHRQAVVGQHHGVPYFAHAQHQVVQQPVEFAGPLGGLRLYSGPGSCAVSFAAVAARFGAGGCSDAG